MMFPLSILLISVVTLIKFSSSVTTDSYPAAVPYHRPAVPPDPAFPYEHTSSSASRTASINASPIQTFSTAPAKSSAASQRGAGDPCGPSNQTDFESTLNTCGQINTTYPQGPSTYGVQCLYANPSWHQVINITSCEININDICLTMKSTKATVSQWNWSSGVCLHSLLLLVLLPAPPSTVKRINPNLTSCHRVPTAQQACGSIPIQPPNPRSHTTNANMTSMG